VLAELLTVYREIPQENISAYLSLFVPKGHKPALKPQRLKSH
jgi:hypothetical protein